MGDPGQIRASAGRVRHGAAAVRQVAVQVAATREVRWQSSTAAAFRHQVSEAQRRLYESARLLDSAADHLEAHAVAVQAMLDGLTGVARFGECVAHAVRVGESVVHAAEAAVDAGLRR